MNLRSTLRAVLSLVIVSSGLKTAAFAQQQPSAPARLDFEFFKNQVQPILLAKRPGRARCVSCHTARPQMHLQPLSPGSFTWDEQQSRQNFESVQQSIVPGSLQSLLLIHPLATEAGGDSFHAGGKHWDSRDAAEWQTLAAWVRGKRADTSLKLRIIQTNSAGDNAHLIDPVTNKVTGEIKDIEINHGVAVAPDGSRMYFSNEAMQTLDTVDARSAQVTSRVALSGRPNNISISRDGRRVYVAINQAPGAVDVIDTASLTRVKSIPTKGGVHNTYVTPDGKFVVAGSIVGKTLTVIDVQTEQPVWSLEFDLGIRPMAFERSADGSTRRIFVQLSDFHGFAVLDFQTRKEITRIELPPLPPGKVEIHEGGNISHGMDVTADNRTLVVTSRQNSALYAYSLPDLKLLGGADVGAAPDWVTLTPDSKTAYVANAGSNTVSVIDLMSMKEVTRIAVGQVPKRNVTAMLQVQ